MSDDVRRTVEEIRAIMESVIPELMDAALARIKREQDALGGKDGATLAISLTAELASRFFAATTFAAGSAARVNVGMKIIDHADQLERQMIQAIGGEPALNTGLPALTHKGNGTVN